MSALLVYKNETPEVLAWVKDWQARSNDVHDRRNAWLDRFCDEHGGPPEGERGSYSRNGEFTGVAWPDGTQVPKGWRRPAEEPRMIKPHLSTRIGKAAAAELATMTYPDGHAELSRDHGMRSIVLVPDTYRYYTPGIRIEDDSVWAAWGSRDVAASLTDAEPHGWVRVPLTEYIERFGEDAL